MSAWGDSEALSGRVLQLDGDRFRLRLDDVPANLRLDFPSWVMIDVDGGDDDVMAYVAAIEDVHGRDAGGIEVSGSIIAWRGRRTGAGSEFAKAARLHRRFIGLMKGRRLTQWLPIAGGLRPVHESLGVDAGAIDL